MKKFDFDGHEKIMKETLRKYEDHVNEKKIQMYKKCFKIKPKDFLNVLITLKDKDDKVSLIKEEIKG